MAKGIKKELSVSVLQNGHPIADTRKLLNKRFRLKIKSGFKGDLALPYYPLINEIEIFQHKQGKLHLVLNHHWSGFVFTNGDMTYLDPYEKDDKIIQLGLNDYGSIYSSDLRILFKVKKVQAEEKIKKIKDYAGNPLALYFHNSFEVKGFTLGLLFTLITTIVLGIIINNSSLNRPQYFYDLSDTYTLPFIDPEKIRTSPEALQSNLDRNHYVKSTVLYYENLSRILMDWDPDENNSFINETLKKRYANLYKSYKNKINSAIDEQEHMNEKQKLKNAVGILTIPTIKGESTQQKIIQLFDQYDRIQIALDELFIRRKEVSHEFTLDEPYDWGDLQGGSDDSRRKRLEYLSKIRVFKDLNNEQMMYHEAENLANLASLKSHQLFSGTSYKFLEREDLKPIILPTNSDFASFLSISQNNIVQNKLLQIQASPFGIYTPKPIYQEPLVGEIDPNLIENVISKNKFQLQLCYELALRRRDIASGTMNWQWRIDSRGRISDIKLVNSSINDNQMTECIKRKLSLWKFPRPRRGSVEVNRSFTFVARKG